MIVRYNSIALLQPGISAHKYYMSAFGVFETRFKGPN
jgi:hypothetical protein